jgi:hypothetical protein
LCSEGWYGIRRCAQWLGCPPRIPAGNGCTDDGVYVRGSFVKQLTIELLTPRWRQYCNTHMHRAAAQEGNLARHSSAPDHNPIKCNLIWLCLTRLTVITAGATAWCLMHAW